MEQQLRAWLRYSIVIGLYVSPAQETTHFSSCKVAKAPLAGQRQAWSTKKSNVQLIKRIYCYAFLFGLCVIFVNGLASQKSTPGMVSWTASTILFASQAASTMFIAWEGYWRQQEQETFLRLLQEIEFSLKLRLKQDVRLDWFVSHMRWLFYYLLWLSIICYTCFVYYFTTAQYVGYFWHTTLYNITMRLRLIQLLIYVRVLQHYLECLSMKLRQIVAHRLAPCRQLLDVNYEKLQSLEYLVAIKEIYGLLFKATQLFNKFAGWSLFSIIVGYMLDYGCALCWSVLSWEGFLESHNYYVPCLWWICPMTLILWHLCHLCNRCKQLVSNKVALLLY